MRLSECISHRELEICTEKPPKEREILEKALQVSCNLKNFFFFAPESTNGGKPRLEWSNLQWPQLKRLLHGFPLELVYTRDPTSKFGLACTHDTELLIANRLWSLWLLVALALDRKPCEIGYIPPRPLRVLVLVIVQLFMDLHDSAPTAVCT